MQPFDKWTEGRISTLDPAQLAFACTTKGEKMTPRSKGERRPELVWRQAHNSNFVATIAANSRVFIIEGISGSGKDTFQAYLKKTLTGRDVYDYSEGELLQSWKQLHIEGIYTLQLRLMKAFTNYIKTTITLDDRAVFLLNRFHLSVYVLAIARRPKLERMYRDIISVLRTLPIHVFILHVDETEIERRSLHPERSSAWQKFQQQILKTEGFGDRLERYIWQQRTMLQLAQKQQIPYSIIRLTLQSRLADEGNRINKTRGIFAAV
ncbi:MAG TPA: hypothetical protein VNO43_06115 [Candidatus Eisenbacteria bacterium]|nr:hypothetical protein [Candidatus Eisenbacteria bacterium]